jgi:hypothetical protein
MNATKLSLSEMITDYPPDHPQNLKELVGASPALITDEKAWELRSQVLSVVRGWDTHCVNSPWDALNLITSGYVLHPWEKAWKSYALNPGRQPVLEFSPKGRSRYQCKSTKLLPKPEELPDLYATVTKSRKPAWLVIYGGNPKILEKEPVRLGLAKLSRMRPIADILFYSNEENKEPVLWSTKAGTGIRGTSRAASNEEPFPHPEYISDIRSNL